MNHKQKWLVPILITMVALAWLSNLWHTSKKQTLTVDVGPYVESTQQVRKAVVPLRQFKAEEGSNKEVDALAVLLKYIPNATEEQKQDVMGFSYHTKYYRSEWQAEVDQLKKQKAGIETNDQLSAAGKDEMLVDWGYRWNTIIASQKAVAQRMQDIDRKTMLERGYPEAMLDELWTLAFPTGRYPWEE